MTAILFDATTYRNASMGFGEGLLPAPAPAFDDMGNRVRVMPYTTADLLWLQADVQERADREADLAALALEAERDAEVSRMHEELELARLEGPDLDEARWLTSVFGRSPLRAC